MSWSCPFDSLQLPLHFLATSASVSMYIPFFFASHFPTSPVVPIGCLVLRFPFIPPALPLFSFLSLSCPFQFPFVSLSFPCTSLHFPFAPQYFPQKKCFSSVFAKNTQKTPVFSQILGKRRQETQSSKKPAGGIKLPRGTWGTPPLPYVSDVGRGGGPVPSQRYPTRLRNVGGYGGVVCFCGYPFGVGLQATKRKAAVWGCPYVVGSFPILT